MAAEEGRADLRFQRADLLRQRRRLHAGRFGCPRDLARLRDGEEVAEVAQFHMQEV
nr:hypothetical protein [Cystobacter ferrugineus]